MYIYIVNKVLFNQVFNENRVIVMLKLAVGGRSSTFGFRSITLVCLSLLTQNLLYGKLISRRSLGLLPRCL